MSHAQPGIRIWFQSAVEMEAASLYRDALSAHIRAVAQPHTMVEVIGVPPGTWAGQQPSALFGYPAIFLAALGPALLRNVVRAEREGFDAFVVGTFIEPFLRELRSAVRIPVLSSLEATLLVGCSVAQTVSLVTINDALRWSLQTSIERHRLGSRAGPVLTLDPPLDEAAAIALLADPTAGVTSLVAAARRAVAAGADAVIPAESILALLAAREGVREVDGAAVLDAIGTPIAMAEMMVTLWRRTGLRTGRRWHMPVPPPELMDLFVSRLP